jgi:aminoglycoside phosphotransferase (APT) family kinase protein
MINPIDDKRFEQLIGKIDAHSKLVRSWKLKGGVSANVIALEILQSDGQLKKMVVRQHGEIDFNRNPHIAVDEFKLLEILLAEGLPVPKPYYIDNSAEIFSTPSIVIEYIDGNTEYPATNLSNHILQLATHLARIHQVDFSKIDVSFLPKLENEYTENLRNRPSILDESLDEGHIRDTLESVWPLPKRNNDVLLHGDFWPGNTLWKDSKLVAIIDWEDAALGDPLADLANAKLEILWAFGIEAMNNFTQHYKSMMIKMDYTNLPYWELCAALRPASKISDWGLDHSTEKTMRERHRWFVTEAIQKLS